LKNDRQQKLAVFMIAALVVIGAVTMWNGRQIEQALLSANLGLPLPSLIALRLMQPRIAAILSLFLLSLLLPLFKPNHAALWLGVLLGVFLFFLNACLILPLVAVRNQLSAGGVTQSVLLSKPLLVTTAWLLFANLGVVISFLYGLLVWMRRNNVTG
jgi:hypothetical protein